MLWLSIPDEDLPDGTRFRAGRHSRRRAGTWMLGWRHDEMAWYARPSKETCPEHCREPPAATSTDTGRPC